MSLVGYWDAIVLGIVEGLTEFLPVSSTGHLTIAEKMLGLPVDDDAITSFTAVIQFGAIVATFIYFRVKIWRLATAWVRGVTDSSKRDSPDWPLAWSVLIGSLPVIVVALLAKDLIKGPLRSLWVVAGALILWSVVMWMAENWHATRPKSDERHEGDVTVKDGLIIGLVQCFSLIPGVSRSGATISAGLFRNLDRVTATELSFFLAIPALTGAGLYELKDVNPAIVGWGPMAVGTFVAFVVAYASIAWLLKFVAHHKITWFVGYRVAVGALLAIALGTGLISAT